MSVTDELIESSRSYADDFAKGDLPLPPARRVAVLACMDARIELERGIRPPWAPESFPDLDEDVRQSIARIQVSPFVPHRDKVRGFVYEVEHGRLREVV